MKKCISTASPPYLNYLLVSIIIFIFFTFSSCASLFNQNNEGKDSNAANDSLKIEWNVLFRPQTKDAIKDTVVNKIYKLISDYYADSGYQARFYPVIKCPCDADLYLISFSPVGGSGRSLVPPPRTETLAGSGDFLDLKSIAVNISINIPEPQHFDAQSVHEIRNFNVDTSKILAFIDSGIDTSLFSFGLNNMMWKDPSSITLHNFLPSHSVNDFFDGTPSKHGSAVASIALKALEKGKRYPKMMILKALDNENEGSIFSVSCALSYAIQKKADVINLSLGYYGEPDSILFHYLQLAKFASPNTQIFTAAGNTPGPHNSGNLCNGANSMNDLSENELFFPACFTPELKHLISVTQLQKPGLPCFYQNYSNQYISLGIVNTNNCCAIASGFSGSGLYEGSSFVTPVACGLRMMSVLNGSDNIWTGMIEANPANMVTKNGNHINYTPN